MNAPAGSAPDGSWDPDAAIGPLQRGEPQGLRRLIEDHGSAIDRALQRSGRPGAPTRVALFTEVMAELAAGHGPDHGLRVHLLRRALASPGDGETGPLAEAAAAYLERLGPRHQVVLWHGLVERDERMQEPAGVLIAALCDDLAEGSDRDVTRAEARQALALGVLGDPGRRYVDTSVRDRIEAAVRPPGGLTPTERVGLGVVALGLVVLVLAVVFVLVIAVGAQLT